MDDDLNNLYIELKISYEDLINVNTDTEKLKKINTVISKIDKIHILEFPSIDKEIYTNFSQMKNETTLEEASLFMYNDDIFNESKMRILKFLIFRLRIIQLKNNIQKNIQNNIQLGGKRTAPAAPAYKLNGEKVSLLINKKKLHRSVYVKGNGKAKYCKINYEFVLLSKLKNKIL